jgi:hypothetical protein
MMLLLRPLPPASAIPAVAAAVGSFVVGIVLVLLLVLLLLVLLLLVLLLLVLLLVVLLLVLVLLQLLLGCYCSCDCTAIRRVPCDVPDRLVVELEPDGRGDGYGARADAEALQRVCRAVYVDHNLQINGAHDDVGVIPPCAKQMHHTFFLDRAGADVATSVDCGVPHRGRRRCSGLSQRTNACSRLRQPV